MPEALVGAGTVLNPQHEMDAVAAGAQFIISRLYRQTAGPYSCQCRTVDPLGVSTPSEVMTALICLHPSEIFPAEANGGHQRWQAISAPLAQVKFCPTGGIGPKTSPLI